jgi:hypothetical protein
VAKFITYLKKMVNMLYTSAYFCKILSILPGT